MSEIETRNPVWLDAAHTAFDVEVAFEGTFEPYTVLPNNPEPLSSQLWAAGIAGDLGVIAEYVAPPPPPLAPLTRRQLRLGLLSNGITTADVEAAIAAIPDPMDRAVAEIEWADASTYERDHHLIEQVGSALGLTHEQIDTMWEAALGL